jgi:peptidoglycan/LPS O-acetylase OafA/YrhL
MKHAYFPEIDGLRAFAVISVLIFHGFPDLLPGGFVGVDIFFTISGYLITSIIFNELSTGSFRYWTFYQRRIRRIFPSLLVVFLSCSVLGWIIFTPAEYELFGTHLATSAGFVPNIRFWREAGYFDKEAITKPLLHLWSLGVEEQFYVLWPIILGVGWKFLKQKLSPLLGFIASLLILSLITSYLMVKSDPVADFYSPLTRFWELGLGGLIAIWSSSNKSAFNSAIQAVFANLGGVLLITSIFMLHEQLSFPGLWALLPCVGTTMILVSISSEQTNAYRPVMHKFLRLPVLVWVGLISYPLYLWHWPLLSFARILEGQNPDVLTRLTLLGLSVVLAYLSYGFLEKPIRKQVKPIWSIGLLVLMAIALSYGIVLRKQDGFKNRHQHQMIASPSTMVLGEFRDSIRRPCHIAKQMPEDLDCFEDVRDPVKYAILGDSKAEALFYGLTTVSSSQGRWLVIDGIHPPPKGGDQVTMAAFYEKSKRAFDLITADPQIRLVLIANSLRSIFPIDPKTGFITSLGSSAASLSNFDQLVTQLENAGKVVLFAIDNPTFPDPTSCISGGLTDSELLNTIFYRKANPYCSIRYQDHLNGTKQYRDWVEQLKQLHPRMGVIDLANYLCDTAQNRCSTVENNAFLYSYSDHISDYAAKKIGADITPLADKSSQHLSR